MMNFSFLLSLSVYKLKIVKTGTDANFFFIIKRAFGGGVFHVNLLKLKNSS